ncbi:class IV adenylate cyclase [Roseateles oligotrophus]|uniref:Class IV adenylate cyclase n=1 Tax=Roseateles oligotrophus TaxID=1769250 RepID=A0ABT2YEE2_9BURK|nr:class IV adenylate cyclase [Roseateles oligotrophus]MCV2368418.1 class IV adenylate cyclase [Roseateles oligotrophus]
MARNIEIKARIASIDALRQLASTIADGAPVDILQDDTFFNCALGRLKLRAFVDGTAQLVFYRRADTQGPKESFYEIAPVHAPEALRKTLTLAYGSAGRVKKQRSLLMVGRTRIHLDRVEGLGDFMELEVVLDEQESAEDGVREAHRIMAALGIQATQLVEGAYLDLLAIKSGL